MKKRTSLLRTSYFIGVIFSCYLVSCVGTKSNKKHDFSQEYYEGLGSNLNRLLEMRKGVFVQYLHDPTGAREDEYWSVNNGEDSTILIARPIGNPAKDGHWLFLFNFMTHAPQEPLTVTFQKYTVSPHSRDTIIVKNYSLATGKSFDWENAFNPQHSFKEINFKELEEIDGTTILVKEDLMKFTGQTDVKNAITYSEKYKKRQDFYTVVPENTKIKVIFYEKDITSEPYAFPAVQMLIKLPKDNQFFPNNTYFKKVKKEEG